MSILGPYQSTLRRWGLRRNPFKPTPPDEVAKLATIFYGRESEIKTAIPALYEGRNILIRGPWGIGKTSLILRLLDCLQQEVAQLDEKMLVLYLDQVLGESPNDFYRALLLVVAEHLAKETENVNAKAIWENLSGRIGLSSKTKVEGRVNFAFASLAGTRESNSPTNIDNPYNLLISILDEAQESFDRIVLAVDDLDKKDVIVIQEILEGSLDLFRRGDNRAFLMTGRGFTDVQEASLKALGIFSENFTLQPMTSEGLYQVAINYLNLERHETREDAYPFTDEVLKQIVVYAQGTPRQLTSICEKVLREGATRGCEQLDQANFMPIWSELRRQVSYELSPQLRQLLYVAQEAGGIHEDIDDRYLDQLGVYTFVQLLPMLKTLEMSDAVIRTEDQTGYRYLPSQLYLPESETESG
ncbi:KAP family NTPase [Phormidium yuhuli AB48]|uniref:KAP family NTPase n=1 Tax=Phormidium yuhuli AB48 TaxID=2940671 RepID=A0ABY5ANG7_9CYAN|nr:P-loop NTPase fold protein [Phormidium yuhuli]USR90750.1 KAP family NTPase [Phormidium yuhuli AB48]